MTDGPQENSHTNRNRKRYKWPMFNFLGKAAQSNVSKFCCLIAEVHCFIAHGTGAAGKPPGQVAQHRSNCIPQAVGSVRRANSSAATARSSRCSRDRMR